MREMHTPHACILSFYVVHTSRPKMITFSSPSQNLHLESVPTMNMGGRIGGRGQVAMPPAEGEGQAHQVDKGQNRNQDLVTADTQRVPLPGHWNSHTWERQKTDRGLPSTPSSHPNTDNALCHLVPEEASI
ncbi:hypothetical protein HJG60_010596 [Phyllostomus discolor]|uniref:Uncharacterized protein n=1 Tax=Phyllostomus discolor TaxID=89673 RepID=A0A834ASB1_9CHIR|nr:hypothetical protein HJG60_010596 [Phyllostomus discolor]